MRRSATYCWCRVEPTPAGQRIGNTGSSSPACWTTSPQNRRRSPQCQRRSSACTHHTTPHHTEYVTLLLVRAVHAGRTSRQTAPSFGQPPPTRCANDTARQVQPSCVRRGWSDRLERTRQQSVRSMSQHRQLRTPT